MPTNCVLLTIDSLRADHATPKSGLMPSLNGYADNGIRLTRAYSNGYSTPNSFPSILTGTHASHYGGDGYMSPERPFLAEAFQGEGFQTAAFHSNPHLRAEKNFDTGFDHYNDFEEDSDELSKLRYLVTQNLSSDSRLYRLLHRVYHTFRSQTGSTDYANAPTLNDRVFAWLDDVRGPEDPFFLWTHYMDVHYPFYPPNEYLNADVSNGRAVSLNGKMHEQPGEMTDEDITDLQALYRGDVRYMDHHLESLVEGFRERGLYDDTVFIITSDHGELFGEYGLFGHPPTGYNESFHVPLVVFGPGVPDSGSVDDFATLLDLAPTLADLFDLHEDERWEGESLLPFGGEGDPEDKKQAVLGDRSVLSCQTADRRLVWWRLEENPVDSDSEWELWDLETGDRVPSNNYDDVESMKTQLQAFMQAVDEDKALDEPGLDDETAERLEALGYR